MITKVHKSVWISASVVAVFVVLFNLQPLAIALATISWSPGISDSTLMVLEHTGQKELKELDQKLRANVPKGHYLVVNSTVNEFYLYKGEQMVKKDICSTGSYVLLKKSEKEKWMFKTPKGEFRIRNKTKDPVWKKPDWAFVEEGLPVPSANHPSRFEYGVLGDYSLSLGDGYLIHGTLFQRFLGLPVTHGCIRLDDENLELVYKSLPMGSKVFIF
ncbi:L,D-transpeptidase [Roseivirga thermotolerans]|uniref:L,D-transpeptidase n=1 Tax=Roseivirga thermotolerans TaxID=1758176 RepID=UPI00273D5972|nr:L,D-transpeptidase [Roseivirga thermotolerans]